MEPWEASLCYRRQGKVDYTHKLLMECLSYEATRWHQLQTVAQFSLIKLAPREGDVVGKE